MTQDEYRAYLLTPHWTQIRNEAVSRTRGRCQLCNSPTKINVHHRTYERIGSELPEDLTVLCQRCHQYFHDHLGIWESKMNVSVLSVGRAADEPQGNWRPTSSPEAERIRKNLKSVKSHEEAIALLREMQRMNP